MMATIYWLYKKNNVMSMKGDVLITRHPSNKLLEMKQ